jgi:ornithine cyclodeaminase/alanine dehydrogenase-like protein (mu-crystallin family)
MIKYLLTLSMGELRENLLIEFNILTTARTASLSVLSTSKVGKMIAVY